MSTVTFDKLSYIDTLKEGGIPPEQARLHASALNDALRDSVATQSDVMQIRHDMQLLEQRIIIKVGLMLFALGGFLTAIKYFG